MKNIEEKKLKEKKVQSPKVVKPEKYMPEEKHSRVMEILKKEYTIENWLLAVLSPILLLYGVYIIMGKFGSTDLTAVLGNSGIKFIDFFFQTTLSRIIVGVVLVLIGTLVIIYLLLPILKPSFVELKKVSWASASQLVRDTTRVFAFLIFLMLLFTLYSLALDPLFHWLYGLKQ
ncbi:MAG: preprotein translocase subunit SecE [Candidatus Izemoplasmatales bacterium]|jgi:preprotein translocase SecE subunit|nr:preprotein translocase subunit SecE [Candidatus Izemoplasmatales bacterium]